MNWTRIAIASVLTGCVGGAALGGPLDPPMGPVASTGKTLTEMEPRIALTQAIVMGVPQTVVAGAPGSYYLTGNVVATATGPSISIASSNVTLDLRGFTVTGRATVPTGNAIDVFGSNVTIRDGNVQGAAGIGINAGANVGFVGHGLRILGNGGNGLVAGNNAQVDHVQAVGNGTLPGGGGGIVLGLASIVTDTIVRLNGGSGISTGECTILTRVSATNNAGSGIVTGNSCNIDQSIACNNTMNGFLFTSSSTLAASNAVGNGAAGFTTSSPLNAACSIHACSAVTNGTVGFATGSGFLLNDCHANLNASHGFVVQTQCRVFNCHSDRNSYAVGPGTVGAAAGFQILGGFNHVENCSAAENGTGFLGVPTAASVFLRNMSSFNGTPRSSANWSIAAPGTFLGPVVTDVGPLTNPAANVSQ